MAAQQQQQGGDNSLAPLWIVAGIFLLFFVSWYLGHAYISQFVLWLRGIEIDFLSLFTKALRATKLAIQAMPPQNYDNITFNELATLSTQVGTYLRYPIIIILLGLALLLYLGNNANKYRQTYTIQKLLNAEKEDWPQIMPVAHLDLVKEDIDKGPWAMALTPMQFAKKHNLLKIEKILPSEASLSNQIKYNATVLRDEAHRVFSLQLGKFWAGVENLPLYARALFAIFAARANGDRKGASKLTLQIAASSKNGLNNLDFSGTEDLLKKNGKNKQVINTVQQHAYVLTVMASMLLLARKDGVLAVADFLWLKPIDRSLWFMLNTMGRQTPFPEVAGAYAHWLAECAMQKRLYVPVVNEAVNALEIAIKEMIYLPDEA